MKKLYLLFPLLLIVVCSNVEGQQQLIPDITGKYENGNIKSITYHKKTRNGIEKIKEEIYHENGQKNSEQLFKDGNLISLKEWNEDGSVKE